MATERKRKNDGTSDAPGRKRRKEPDDVEAVIFCLDSLGNIDRDFALPARRGTFSVSFVQDIANDLATIPNDYRGDAFFLVHTGSGAIHFGNKFDDAAAFILDEDRAPGAGRLQSVDDVALFAVRVCADKHSDYSPHAIPGLEPHRSVVAGGKGAWCRAHKALGADPCFRVPEGTAHPCKCQSARYCPRLVVVVHKGSVDADCEVVHALGRLEPCGTRECRNFDFTWCTA